MPPQACELNLDGLVGPTHTYGGLSYGNLASTKNVRATSNPKAAALQGLQKMKRLSDLGVKQAVFPPQERPHIETLRRLGFQGADAQILDAVARKAPLLLNACSSASSMWMANAATISPGPDTADGRVHITPANLVSQFHRSIEPPTTAALLKTLFKDEARFAHHPPLPPTVHFSDEGAANHTRLCRAYHEPGIELFVYGKQAFASTVRKPAVFPARQSLEASAAVARLHGLDPERTVFALQNPDAIDAGVFHNDVISVGNQNVFFYHALAFANPQSVIEEIKRKFSAACQTDLILLEVRPDQISIDDAVQSYLFNSQLLTLPNGEMCLIAPVECRKNSRVEQFLKQLTEDDNPIQTVYYVDTRQSMKNGGGPACLRLRIVLTEDELLGVHQGVLITDLLYDDLTAWVNRFYRDRLHPKDLSDPQLLKESRAALDALTRILDLGAVYRFQQTGTS